MAKIIEAKKCICQKHDTGTFQNKAGFIVGVIGNVLLTLIGLIGVIFYAFNIDRSWIFISLFCLAIIAVDFGVSFLARKAKGHTAACSLRYARINIFYSGVLF